METRPYCGDCPDPEACHQGVSCEYVREVAAYFNHLDAVMTGRGRSNMTNTTGTKSTKSSVDAVVEEAAKEKLVSEIPSQVDKDEKTEESTTGEKAAPEVEETGKKTVASRLKALAQKAKDHRSFFMGVVTGAAGTALVMALAAKEKVEEVVELAIADEPEPEVEGDTDDTTV